MCGLPCQADARESLCQAVLRRRLRQLAGHHVPLGQPGHLPVHHVVLHVLALIGYHLLMSCHMDLTSWLGGVAASVKSSLAPPVNFKLRSFQLDAPTPLRGEQGPLLAHEGDQHHVPGPQHVGDLASPKLIENVPHLEVLGGAGHIPHREDLPLGVLASIVHLWVSPVPLLHHHLLSIKLR